VFAQGQRVGICGANGLGKTTLLKLIIGGVPPSDGTVKIGQLTKFNYVDQARLQLDEEHSVLEEVADGTEFVQWGEAKLSLRAYLKRFLFADDRITTQVKYLSGGERSRLMLARILKRGGNFLILDEPTNDLDLPTLRVLEEALIAFPGVVCVVSHDRYFLNRVCTDIIAFEGDGKIRHSAGDYDYYLEKKQIALLAARRVTEPTVAKKAAPTPSREGESLATPAKPRKLSFKELRELEGMERQIQEVEAEIARIENLFAAPDFHRTHATDISEWLAKLAAAKTKLPQLYSRWEALEGIKAAAGPTPKKI
jgi:ABC-type multidrug transport system ATPase subunit